MGFGKFLLGGVCAVGAVIAAPVVLPVAGAAIAGSTLTGAAGVAAGMAVAGASTTTAAVVAGAAGVAAGAAQEKKFEKAYDEGHRKGYVVASDEYAKKFRDQAESFNQTTAECEKICEKHQAEKEQLKRLNEDMLRCMEEKEIER